MEKTTKGKDNKILNSTLSNDVRCMIAYLIWPEASVHGLRRTTFSIFPYNSSYRPILGRRKIYGNGKGGLRPAYECHGRGENLAEAFPILGFRLRGERLAADNRKEVMNPELANERKYVQEGSRRRGIPADIPARSKVDKGKDNEILKRSSDRAYKFIVIKQGTVVRARPQGVESAIQDEKGCAFDRMVFRAPVIFRLAGEILGPIMQSHKGWPAYGPRLVIRRCGRRPCKSGHNFLDHGSDLNLFQKRQARAGGVGPPQDWNKKRKGRTLKCKYVIIPVGGHIGPRGWAGSKNRVKGPRGPTGARGFEKNRPKEMVELQGKGLKPEVRRVIKKFRLRRMGVKPCPAFILTQISSYRRRGREAAGSWTHGEAHPSQEGRQHRVHELEISVQPEGGGNQEGTPLGDLLVTSKNGKVRKRRAPSPNNSWRILDVLARGTLFINPDDLLLGGYCYGKWGSEKIHKCGDLICGWPLVQCG